MSRGKNLAVFYFGIAALLSSTTALATTIDASYIRSSGSSFAGMAVDATTGVAYQMDGYGVGYDRTSTSIKGYADAAAFESGTTSGTMISTTNFWGTYIAAQDGSVFGRSSTGSDSYGWPADAKTTKISGSTGITQATVTVAAMGGINGPDSFDWGGFSCANAMNDGYNLYVVGSDATSDDWRISTFDYNLNALNSVSFSTSGIGDSWSNNPGWGFAINGYIFFGNQFTSLDSHASKWF